MQSLEQLRPRLTQLTHSLRKLEESLRVLQYSTSSGDLTTIQNQFNVILQQLASLSKTLQSCGSTLEVTTVFPNREFDTNSGLLSSLLRKKLTPEVQQWIHDAKSSSISTLKSIPQTATSSATQASFDTAAATTQSIQENLQALQSALFSNDNLTDTITEYARDSLEDYMFGGYLTKKELEQGLKVSDILKDLSKEELESPSSSSMASPGPSSHATESQFLRFVYQGLDSNSS